MKKIVKNIFVGMSSSDNVDNSYKKLAYDIGKILSKTDYHLILGGNETGLMKELYLSFTKERQDVRVIIENIFKGDNNKYNNQIDFYKNCDILLYLPGGSGTLYELLSSINYKVNYGLDYKIIIYNYNGFYDKLIDYFDFLLEEKFNVENPFIVVNNTFDLQKEIGG